MKNAKKAKIDKDIVLKKERECCEKRSGDRKKSRGKRAKADSKSH